jgi:hypothetical protein
MPHRRLAAVLTTLSCGLACASTPPPAESPPAPSAHALPPASASSPAPEAEQKAETEASEEAAEEPAEAAPLPKECAGKGKLCTPPSDFVDRLCAGKFPGVAIAMFNKRAPWKHLYVKIQSGVDASNTLGGPNGEERLQFAEEVLILREKGTGGGGMQVSGMAGYHVLRWDGTCATVSTDELVDYQPGLPKNAVIRWKYLGRAIQRALETKKPIKAAEKEYRKACRGGRFNRNEPACVKATKELNRVILLAVRKGMDLPEPDRRP